MPGGRGTDSLGDVLGGQPNPLPLGRLPPERRQTGDMPAGLGGSAECLRATAGAAGAHARARERVLKLTGPPAVLTIDIDATLITAHSEMEGASGNYKGGFGFHPLLAYGDENREALAAVLLPGRARSNTAADQIQVAAMAWEQIPAADAQGMELVAAR
jgi:Transposase DDE domain group 1